MYAKALQDDKLHFEEITNYSRLKKVLCWNQWTRTCLVDKFEEGGQCKGLNKVNQLAITEPQNRTKTIPRLRYVALADSGGCFGPSVHTHGCFVLGLG
jgi:hypothetical protein